MTKRAGNCLGSRTLFVLILGGCASTQTPVAQLERANQAVTYARDQGAAFVPYASPYFTAASSELDVARRLAAHGRNDHAISMAMRAEADADVAARLAHEASLRAVRIGGGPSDPARAPATSPTLPTEGK